MTLYKVGEIADTTGITINLQGTSVIALRDGGWVTVWAEVDGQGHFIISQQQYNASGIALLPLDSDVQKIAVTQADEIVSPVATALSDGGWIVSWTAIIADNTERTLFQERYLPNQAPSGATLVGSPVAEGISTGVAVGSLGGLDPNLTQGDALTFALVDDSGGRFFLAGDTLFVGNALALDYEQATSHAVAVRVTDRDGSSIIHSVTVQVADVARENLTGRDGPDHFVGGADSDVFRGAAGADRLTGGGGSDVLDGGIGDDRLTGGLGNDALTGGAGKDVFVFDAAPNKKTNLDKITDFKSPDDAIWLDNAVFPKLGKKGSLASPEKLSKGFFTLGTKAKDGNDHLIYTKKTGALFYDPDGDGAKAAIKIATLKKKANVTLKDFFVI